MHEARCDELPSLEPAGRRRLWSGKVVHEVRPDEKCVNRDAITGDEDEITYEKLIIATGARAKVLDEQPYLWPDKHSDVVDNGSIEDEEDVACAPAPAPAGAPGDGACPQNPALVYQAEKNCGFGSVSTT